MIGTLFLIALVIVITIAVAVRTKTTEYSGIRGICEIAILLGGIVLTVMIIMIPLMRCESDQDIVGFKEIRRTINEARLNSTYEIEGKGLAILIAEQNGMLARAKEANRTWDLWCSDEVDNIQPLK